MILRAYEKIMSLFLDLFKEPEKVKEIRKPIVNEDWVKVVAAVHSFNQKKLGAN